MGTKKLIMVTRNDEKTVLEKIFVTISKKHVTMGTRKCKMVTTNK